jgi:hypothetical protein
MKFFFVYLVTKHSWRTIITCIDFDGIVTCMSRYNIRKRRFTSAWGTTQQNNLKKESKSEFHYSIQVPSFIFFKLTFSCGRRSPGIFPSEAKLLLFVLVTVFAAAAAAVFL